MADPWRTTTTLTIASGQTASEVLDFGNTESFGSVAKKRKYIVLIIAPAVLAETVNPHVARVAGGTYGILRSSGTAIALAACNADQLYPIVCGAMKLVATGAVAADRVFNVIVEPAHNH